MNGFGFKSLDLDLGLIIRSSLIIIDNCVTKFTDEGNEKNVDSFVPRVAVQEQRLEMKLEIEGIGKYHVDYTVPRRAKAQTLELGIVQGTDP